MVSNATTDSRDCSVQTCWHLMNMLNSVHGDTQQLSREIAVFKLVDSRWMRSVQLTVTLMQQLTRETAAFELVDSWWMRSVLIKVTLIQQLTRETAVFELVDSWWMRSVQFTVTLIQLTRHCSDWSRWQLMNAPSQFTVTLKQQLTRETAEIELVDIDGCLEFSSHGDTSTGNRNK